MKPRTVIFDFDGVIVESNAIKDRAFYDLYLPFGEEAADRALEIHLQHHGKSRFEKFHLMHERILNQVISEAEQVEFGDRFSQICFERICVCPFVPGAQEFLRALSSHIRLSIASATPEVELEQIVAKRGIGHHFKYIFGKPTSKPDNLRRILELESLVPFDAIFVGDQISDWEAAHEVGVPFVGRVADRTKHAFPASGPLALIDDLTSLADVLKLA